MYTGRVAIPSHRFDGKERLALERGACALLGENMISVLSCFYTHFVVSTANLLSICYAII